ncbi:MAG: aspartate dehydrogenase [Candidatus Methylomirabilales bacterium]
MLRVGIVGAGNIGSTIAAAIDEEKVAANLIAVADRNPDRARNLAGALKHRPAILSLAELVKVADLVVEAASQSALDEIVPATLSRGKDLVVLSVGGLLGREEWVALAEQHGARIYCPSGALAGLDGVKGARVGEIKQASIRTRKPPRGLQGAPYLTEHGIDLSGLSEARVVFEGSAREACRGFPANVNVAAALSLTGVGPERTRVTIIADPAAEHNIHEIEVVGEFGRLHAQIENVPSTNPRTGKLAAFSAIALLKELTLPLRVGT